MLVEEPQRSRGKSPLANRGGNEPQHSPGNSHSPLQQVQIRRNPRSLAVPVNLPGQHHAVASKNDRRNCTARGNPRIKGDFESPSEQVSRRERKRQADARSGPHTAAWPTIGSPSKGGAFKSPHEESGAEATGRRTIWPTHGSLAHHRLSIERWVPSNPPSCRNWHGNVKRARRRCQHE